MITKYFKIQKNKINIYDNKIILKKIINNKTFKVKDSHRKIQKEFIIFKEFPIFEKIIIKKSYDFDNDIESDTELITNDITILENHIKNAILNNK